MRDGVLILRDRETGSVWTHLDGEATDGPLAGANMEIIPIVHTTWEEWQILHPDTLVLSDDTDFQDRYRQVTLGMPNGRFGQELLTVDDRLASEALVLGVLVDDVHVAYPLSELEQSSGVINDEVAGVPIVIFYDIETASGIAFSRDVNGEVAQFEFVAAGSFQARDSVSDTVWDFSGAGVGNDASLEFVSSYLSEWYGWSAYHPETSIYALP